MKIYKNYALTEIVREPETFRTPKNLILQSLVFWLMFFVMELAQASVLLSKFWDYILEWGAKKIEETGTVPMNELTQEIRNIMLVPEMINSLLYATIMGTLTILFFCRVIENRKFRTMGFSKKKAGLQYLTGLIVGFVLFSCTVGLGFLMGGLQFEGIGQFSPAILVTLLGFGFQGLNEEVTYRGYFMTSVMRNHSVWWAIGLNSLFFGLGHAFNDGFSLFTLCNLVLYSVMISLYVLRTNSLWGACAIHSIWNFSEGNFYGLPVSGVNTGHHIFEMSLKGSSLVNGGDFGIEAGIPTTIVTVAGILILLFCPLPFLDKKEEETA